MRTWFKQGNAMVGRAEDSVLSLPRAPRFQYAQFFRRIGGDLAIWRFGPATTHSHPATKIITNVGGRPFRDIDATNENYKAI
jgi:hypothetical protein